MYSGFIRCMAPMVRRIRDHRDEGLLQAVTLGPSGTIQTKSKSKENRKWLKKLLM